MKLIRYATPDLTELDRFFNQALSNLGRFNDWVGASPTTTATFRPAADLFEDRDNYVARIELPGVPKEKINVQLDRDTLSITAEVNEEREDQTSSARWSRKFTLPEGVDGSKIDARLENGILQLTLPKVEHAKPRQIEVR